MGTAAGRASAHLRPLEQEATEMRKGTRVSPLSIGNCEDVIGVLEKIIGEMGDGKSICWSKFCTPSILYIEERWKGERR